MMTISNGKVLRASLMRVPTSYSGVSPVPVSPMTANLSESGRVGSSDRLLRRQEADGDNDQKHDRGRSRRTDHRFA